MLVGCAGPAEDEPLPTPFRVPAIRIDGAATSPEHARRIEQIDPRRLASALEFLGLQDPGGEILLALVSEGAVAARSAPAWISGYALSERGVAVLFPARTPSYPDSTFEELVLHEIGHILVFRAVAGGQVPRWFNEGLALHIGRPWRLEDHSRVTWALVSGRQVSLADLEPYFNTSREAAKHAYALAGAFVQDLVGRHGAAAVGQILNEVANGVRFEEAFFRVTAETLTAAEQDFWSRHTFFYRWVPVIGSSATLWLLITVLALLAFRRRRRRDAEILESWDREDPAASGDADSEPS